MSKVNEMLEQIVRCSNCYGQGVTGWVSPDGDYDFDYCDCNPYNIPADEVAEYHQLFAGSEA